MLSLAEQEIFERYKHPVHAGVIEAADITADGANQSCGDEVTLTLRLENGVVTEAKHQTRACAVCTAAADLLCERAIGKTPEQLVATSTEEVADELGIPLSPVRLKCALLPLETVKQTVTNIPSDT